MQPIVNEAHVQIDFKEMVLDVLDKLDAKKEELKTAREMLQAELDNDPDFEDKTEECSKANKKRSEVRARILSGAPGHAANEKVKEIKETVDEIKDQLGAYLAEYTRTTKSTSIISRTGKKYTIIPKYQLTLF